jgi:Bacteriophage minor capsid protein
MTATLLDNFGTYLPIALPPTTYGKQGLLLGANLFLARIPAEAPNAVVVISQYEGQAPTFTMGNAVSALEHPRIQVMVRGEREDYPGAYGWSVLIRNTLAGLILPDTHFPNVIRIEPLGIPNPTGYDNIERPRFTMNFQVHLNAMSDGKPQP